MKKWNYRQRIYYKFIRFIGYSSGGTNRSLFSLFLTSIYFVGFVVLIDLSSLIFLDYEKTVSSGTFGDFFGGILNPILTFLMFMGVIISIVLQQKELRLTRQELKNSSLRSASAFEHANQLTKEAYIATQRAWLKVSAQIGDNLTYDVNGLNITASIQCTNIGHSPALDMNQFIHLEAVAVGVEGRYHIQDIFREFIDSHRMYASNDGSTIFPNETATVNLSTSIPLETLDKITEKSSDLCIIILVAVNYKLVYDKNTTHQTSVAYDLFKAEGSESDFFGKTKITPIIKRDQGNISIQELKLLPSWLIKGKAD